MNVPLRAARCCCGDHAATPGQRQAGCGREVFAPIECNAFPKPYFQGIFPQSEMAGRLGRVAIGFVTPFSIEREWRATACPGEACPNRFLGLDPRVDPVRQGEPLFADQDMRQFWNLRRFPFKSVHCVNLDHPGDPYEREAL
jgi:hypothetical protein